ncbi:MAG: hypothetical protein R3E39_28980 [Anaerolineae bacterium]
MDKTKQTPAFGVPGKLKETSAPIEFVAPYDVRDCRLRLRDTRRQEPGFMSAGFDPSFEDLGNGIIRFRIRRTWYDTRWRRHTSTVEMRGYLKGIDAQSTAVIAAVYVSWWFYVVLGLLLTGLVAGSFISGMPTNILFLIVSIGLVFIPFALTVYFDRRALRNLIYR